MSIVFPYIVIGLIYAIIVFFIVENLSLKHKDSVENECVIYDVNKVYICLEKYQTIKYAIIYLILLAIYASILAIIDFIPKELGLMEVLVYIFTTAFLGSLYILIFKWRKDFIIKIFSSLMFGSLFIAGSAIGFAISYLMFK